MKGSPEILGSDVLDPLLVLQEGAMKYNAKMGCRIYEAPGLAGSEEPICRHLDKPASGGGWWMRAYKNFE